jgi:hypothetical protein
LKEDNTENTLGVLDFKNRILERATVFAKELVKVGADFVVTDVVGNVEHMSRLSDFVFENREGIVFWGHIMPVVLTYIVKDFFFAIQNLLCKIATVFGVEFVI